MSLENTQLCLGEKHWAEPRKLHPRRCMFAAQRVFETGRMNSSTCAECTFQRSTRAEQVSSLGRAAVPH